MALYLQTLGACHVFVVLNVSTSVTDDALYGSVLQLLALLLFTAHLTLMQYAEPWHTC
jgi:hypothetical protein